MYEKITNLTNHIEIVLGITTSIDIAQIFVCN